MIRETLEAYVTSQGELRVRAIKKDLEEDSRQTETSSSLNGKIEILKF